jgi:hypothetical protein
MASFYPSSSDPYQRIRYYDRRTISPETPLLEGRAPLTEADARCTSGPAEKPVTQSETTDA